MSDFKDFENRQGGWCTAYSAHPGWHATSDITASDYHSGQADESLCRAFPVFNKFRLKRVVFCATLV
jgi:hypothetical protein